MNNFNEFKTALIRACDEQKDREDCKEDIELRKQFVEEYPISRLREMELDEYVTGRASEDNFCYKIEFGKYKRVGLGLGGGSATKFGIYYSKKEQIYKISGGTTKPIPIDNPEEYWLDFRKQLCDFLEECGRPDFDFDFDLAERYPKLSRMGIVLNKLCFLYCPDTFLNASYRTSEFLSEKLNISNPGQYNRVKMPFIIMTELKQKIPELFANKYDTQVIGNAAWELYHELQPISKNKGVEDSSNENVNDEDVIGGENIIYYGNPGCGKSYIVKKKYESGDYQSYHTVFHPDYTNSDFVGQILPSVSESGVSYRSVPGPFTKALFTR